MVRRSRRAGDRRPARAGGHRRRGCAQPPRRLRPAMARASSPRRGSAPTSTCRASASRATSSRSRATTCASDRGRSSGCSATSTGIPCRRASSRSSPAGPRAGRQGSSCSISPRAASPPTSAVESSAAPARARGCCASTSPGTCSPSCPTSSADSSSTRRVLVRLTGDLCDELLERRGSALLLDELARRQLFTVAVDDADGSFRYHEVLRSHLDRMLVEEVGEAEARRRHQRGREPARAERRAPRGARAATAGQRTGRPSDGCVGESGEQVAGGARTAPRAAAARARSRQPVAGARLGAARARRRPLVRGDRGVRACRGGIRGVAGRRDVPTGAPRARRVAGPGGHPARRLDGRRSGRGWSASRLPPRATRGSTQSTGSWSAACCCSPRARSSRPDEH